MIITKSDVLKAIEAEPLIANHWVQPGGGEGCAVCAVGAVLRGQGLDYRDIIYTAPRVTQDKYCSSAGSIPAELQAGNYLGALSMQFERFCELAPNEDRDRETESASLEYVAKVVKPALIEWAKDCLPEGVLYRD